MIRQSKQDDFVLDPNFDLCDCKEAVGEVQFDGITADEPNDCDHLASEASCGEVRCVYCGKRLG